MEPKDGGSTRDPDPDARGTRRDLLRAAALAGAGALLSPLHALAQSPSPLIVRKIPSSGEAIPVVGLGSWITFNVGDDRELRDECAEVIRTFFAAGGRMIDSSPMYGSSQAVIGHALGKLRRPSQLFAADKVWTSDGSEGPSQIEESRRHWGIAKFDLLQVHNLVTWERHLPLLQRMKTEGRLRYTGISTSEGRRHEELERIMRTQSIDFVQLTYNPVDREAEARLLPLARERGIAVIANRPFRQGALTRRLARQPLPSWAKAIGATSWAQIILKFIVSDPVITCAIPATSNPAHARENLAAARGAMPDAAMRRRIADEIGRL